MYSDKEYYNSNEIYDEITNFFIDKFIRKHDEQSNEYKDLDE